jgi:hypothetical protein
MADYEWLPLSPRETAKLLADLRAPWWVAGGWAIDLFLGRQTRPHADTDTALLRGTEPALREVLPAWDIQIAHDGEFIAWDGGPLEQPYHQFWARPNPESPWALEFMLEEHDNGTWFYRRDTRVMLSIADLGRTTADGVPFICPKVALLYKAWGKGAERNAADFESAFAALSMEERGWLRDALLLAYPGHAWTDRLK